MFNNIIKFLGGDPTRRELERLAERAKQINTLEAQFEALSDDALLARTAEFRQRLAGGQTLDEILDEAFAAVREASKRTIGLRHYDVQLIGGIVLHGGKIAEMRTGEGKTLVATLPLYLNALEGKGSHLVTVNDYLARRDARWMAPIYHALGMTVGVLQMAARTDNGRNAFIVDLEKTTPHEDQNQLRLVMRSEAYQADITYGTNNEYGFDYLRDNLTMSLAERVQRGHHYAIVDEVDNILIDEARTPLIISGPASEDTGWYARMAQVVRALNPEDYEISEKDRTVNLTEIGEVHIEELLETPLRDPDRPEDITPEQARLMGHLEQALRSQFLYKRNKDYLVQSGKVVIVDEFTGRLMPGRRWSEGLHQAVEAKEGVKVEPENATYATITLQNYFRMYARLAGMTGTAQTESEEFSKIYKLEVVPIPTNLEYNSNLSDSPLIVVDDRDEMGYKFQYYAHRGDSNKTPVYWRRKDYPDAVYRSEEGKLRAISIEILREHVRGRPMLVGTTSVEHSERLSDRLAAEPIRRLVQIILIRRAFMSRNNLEIIDRSHDEMKPTQQPLMEIEAGALRPLVRSLGISLNAEEPENLQVLLSELRLDENDIPRLIKVLQGGIPHQVLNARRHDEESQIIARAGAFGSVTIATNMAGRGVDIKLGGELPDDVLRDTNRVLVRPGFDPYDLTNDERKLALEKIPPEEYGIYEESVKAFLEHVENMYKVRQLGGLYVIGSERHEARRIDNQLRGRSARQGDSGSSRFYLSLEDDLMRLFGGQQVEAMWSRLMFDESQPIEMNILGRLVEQSQERVEGSNFDVRKHLLEYDDVLNSQRKRIYEQRDRVFTKEDLSEDILDMLRSELQVRIPKSLKDEEGPWRLLAFLDDIQPQIEYEHILHPTFTVRLLTDDIRSGQKDNPTQPQVKSALLDLARRSLEAEHEHLMRWVRNLLDTAEDNINRQLEERMEVVENYIDTLGDEPEEGAPARRVQDSLNELNELARLPLRLTQEQQGRLMEGDKKLLPELRTQVESFLAGFTASRLVGAVERRLDESLNLRSVQLQGASWGELVGVVLDNTEKVFSARMQRLLGDNGQIAQDLDAAMNRLNGDLLDYHNLVQMLSATLYGSKVVFDARTHRKGTRRFQRLNYVFLAARMLEGSEAREITPRVLEHLEEGLKTFQSARGLVEWRRLVQNEVVMRQLVEGLQADGVELFGAERYESLVNLPLMQIEERERDMLCALIGRRIQNELNRQLLLRVITDLWVDYLTRVEALRVSIGMEAYAQRDPLVQYKGKASEMFGELLAEIRLGVISKMMTYTPRRMAAAIETEGIADGAAPGSPADPSGIVAQLPESGKSGGEKKKRKRH
jgi:preprotein translocase subunit SecA